MLNLQQWGENLLLTALFPTLVEQIGIAANFVGFAVIGVFCTVYLAIFLKSPSQAQK